ncbi:LPS-assembly protein LptD [Acinetobacter sp. ANC 4633]|uniref:LPS-assembly protein LptD n=1 Tax=Acinetobacter sp. ANC 4633 TaxID=2529845 RepID=UPI00103C6401|nr:LPS assembly protein LptD [Acinetobacter sp. ANC 4633]TCB23976.1 LPS-assembly protein LptD [Acinetobacter sp. ANC 4633]
MKQQFRFNPLATAILTLLCGSSIQSSYAASSDAVSSVDNQQLKQQLNESYPGQNFFEQYYVSKDSPEAQQRVPDPKFSPYCQGVWVTPIQPNTKASDPNKTTTYATADYGFYNPNGDSELKGNAIIDQEGRQIRAEQITIDKDQTLAHAQGNVQLAQNGLVSQSNHVDYNLKEQMGNLNDSYFIAEQTHAHGHAQNIERTSASTTILKNASYTACAPDKTPEWHIQAKKIELNQETGRGTTHNSTLYVKNVPVMYLPYYNFPIDDRRTTGLLTPSFGWSSSEGFQISLPVYLNLAPNYDLTLIPRYLGTHGAMLEGNFNYKTANFGEGTVSGGYLPNDPDYNYQDRKSLHIKHEWTINQYLTTHFNYNYLSDINYIYDIKNDPNISTDLNQTRLAQLNFANAIPGLNASLKVESYQTLDKTLSDADRPYARLPQFLLNYTTQNPQGWQFEYHNDSTYFKKDTNDPTLANNGTRLYNSAAVRYNYRTPWAFVIPEASVRSLNYFYNQNTSSSQNKTVVVPQFTLDTGLNFEKEGKFLQTLTPRLFYAYAPYKNQNGYPNFNTTTASVSYDQLFSPYRFYGNDRLDDNNFMSLGLSYSLFDQQGLERLKAAVGKSFYFSDRKVTLNDGDIVQTSKQSDPVLSLSSQITNHFTIASTVAWDNSSIAQAKLQTYYTSAQGTIYNLGYYKRKEVNNAQLTYNQVVASLIQPVKDNWRIIGHVQYDIDHSLAREFLLGINYESCCWAVSVYGRSYYNDLDDVTQPGVNRKNAIMAEFTLKGLGAFNNKLASLLEERVVGFNKSNQSWTQSQ